MAYRYRVAGEEIELETDDDLVAVRYKEPALHSTRRSVAEGSGLGPFGERVEVPREKFTVMPVAQTAEPRVERAAAVVSRLEEASDVARVAPVFRSGGSRIIATDRLLVGFEAGTEDAVEILTANGCEVIEQNGSEFLTRIAEGEDPFLLASALDALDSVAYAEPDFVCFRKRLELRPTPLSPQSIVHPTVQPSADGPQTTQQYAPVITRAVDAWKLQLGDPDVVIAVLDEGVDTTHQDLGSAIVGSFDGADNDSFQEPKPWDGHGTACAGLAAAIHNNDLGIKGIGGGCSMQAIRIAYSEFDGGNWTTSNSWITRAIDWAWQNGASILSNSWGGGAPSTAIINAFDRARTQGRGGKGCVVVVAAGNDSSAVDFPGKLRDILTVSASNEFDEFKTKSSRDAETWWGSNFGPEVDVAAPGVHNMTTDISGASGYSNSDYFASFNGTSSATPIVAGAVGLVLSANSELTEEEARDVIRQSADKVGSAAYTNGRNDQMGFGRLNVLAAVELALPRTPSYRTVHRVFKDVPIRDKQTSMIQVAVGDSRPIRSIEVDVDIEHTYVGDLVVRLLPPQGQGGESVSLHKKDQGGSSDDLVETYGLARIPELADLRGKSLPGLWTLEVHDSYAQDEGKIRSFGLTLEF